MKTRSSSARPSAGTPALAAALSAAMLAGCGLSEEDLGETSSAVSVSSYETSTCSTSVVLGLSKQIADEISCTSPTLLARFDPSTRLQITSNAVLPYLHSTAKTDIVKVAGATTVQVNSAFRTVAQQYLLYQWYQLGRCGITAAATPGRSNHESGRALDLANYSSVISAMSARGWAHDVAGDPVHFDHLSSPDIRGKDVLAFQRLWNRNHPTDKISEDGAYGPQTESRLKQAPATGFAVGPTCAAGLAAADVVMVDGPDRVAPGAQARYTLTLDNTTAVDWPASTRMRVADGTSPLYDAATWTSPAEPGAIGTEIAAGARGVLQISVRAPAATEETPLFTQLELTDGAATLGTFNLALTVTPGADHGESADAGDQNDDGILVTGGCSAGGGAGWAALVLPALIAVRRRRRCV